MTSPTPDTLEYDYRILKMIEEHPELSQRAMAEELGISVGRTNYVLSALVERGFVRWKISKSLTIRRVISIY